MNKQSKLYELTYTRDVDKETRFFRIDIYACDSARAKQSVLKLYSDAENIEVKR
jgi:hypothetical protein